MGERIHIRDARQPGGRAQVLTSEPSRNGSRHTGRKALFIALAVLAAIVLIFVVLDRCIGVPVYYFTGENASHDFSCDNQNFYHEQTDGSEEFLVKAISVSPDDATDLEGWEQVLDLVCGASANTVQAEDVMPPAFYQALKEHNESAEDGQTLFLLQRVKLGDDAYSSMADVYSGGVADKLYERGKLAVDAVNGRRNIAGYFWDVSEYTLGYAIGDDWDPKLIAYSQELKQGESSGFSGEYYRCTSAYTYFEAQMAKTFDKLMAYETHKYNHQTPLGFWNWSYTDQIAQTYSVEQEYNSIVMLYQSVIDSSMNNQVGTFASYNLVDASNYIISTDTTYQDYVDENGEHAPFEAYVNDVVDNANGPVVVSFGVSSSRGVSGEDDATSSTQGHLTEEEQGERISKTMSQIVAAGGKGFCVPLYDDATATTWNADTTAACNGAWVNVQSSNQALGLIAYDSDTFRVDGDDSEWASVQTVSESNGTQLKMACDETYLYLDVPLDTTITSTNILYIALDVTPLSGASSNGSGLTFDRDMDFLVKIPGKSGAEILVQQYYDGYAAAQASDPSAAEDEAAAKPERDGTTFDPIRQYTRRAVDASDGKVATTFSATSLVTGTLRHGNADPDSAQYDSLADYCIGKDCVEVRIPWALLNFYDPSNATVLGDPYDGDGERTTVIDGIYAGATLSTSAGQTTLTSGEFSLPGWKTLSEGWRVKESYEAVKEAYASMADQ